MERRAVGESGLQVSRLGLGSLTWGRDVPPVQARALLRRFVEAGGTLVDTAAAYGNGEAERIIGRAIHTDLTRDDLVIATKGGFGVRDGKRVVDTSRAALLDDLAEFAKAPLQRTALLPCRGTKLILGGERTLAFGQRGRGRAA